MKRYNHGSMCVPLAAAGRQRIAFRRKKNNRHDLINPKKAISSDWHRDEHPATFLAWSLVQVVIIAACNGGSQGPLIHLSAPIRAMVHVPLPVAPWLETSTL